MTQLGFTVAEAPRPWRDHAEQALYLVASHAEELTSDDVWEAIGDVPRPREPRAMGAIMQFGQQQKWIETTMKFVNSKKETQHSQPIRVWRSLIYHSAKP